MNFKRIEMYGFKSFADKLEIQFDNGITGIVGPNGCGKSNVADSIRWVLGEQSAKTLRGGSMTDVIFNGTAERKSLSYCEVSLVFDNSEKKVPLDYSEIVITRKLYRSGESEYSINRAPSRLKDITDLLRDMNIAKDGYTIIGQGKVDEIISSKPVDRRAIFEEACGISKFKARKVETERKLARTHDNLLRLNDILTELERQVEPLGKQAEAAKKYLELKETLKHHEINSFIVQYDSVNVRKAAIGARLEAVNEELNLRQSEYDAAGAEYDKNMDEISGIDSDIEELRDSQLELSLGIEKQTGELKVVRERANFLQQNLERLESDRSELENRLQSLSAAAQEKAEEKRSADADYRELQGINDTLTDELFEVMDLISRRETGSADAQREAFVSLERLTEIRSNYSSLSAEKKALEGRKEKLLPKLAELKAKEEQQEEESASLTRRLDALREGKAELGSERERDIVERSALLTNLKENEDELRRLEQHRSNYSASVAMLKRIKDSFEGYQRSVRSLLSDAKTDIDLGSRICGTVAQLMTVPKEYETAVDVSLGQSMQNVVVHEEQDAKYLIAYLKGRSYGRVTFLPVETVKGRTLDASAVRALEGCRGYLGIGSELVSHLPVYANIFKNLLGRTVFADTLDNAVIIARRSNYTVRIVTLEGEIIHPFGAMTGGSSKSGGPSEILTAERELSESSAILKRTEERIAALTETREELSASESALSEKLKGSDAKLKETELLMVSLMERKERCLAELDSAVREYRDLAQENFLLGSRLDELESDLALADEMSGTVIKQKDSAVESDARLREEFENLKARRDALQQSVTDNKLRLAALDSKSVAADREALRLKSESEDAGAQLEKTLSDLDAVTAAVRELRSGEKDYEPSPEQVSMLEAIKVKLSSLDEFKRSRQESLGVLDDKREELSKEIRRVTETRFREESALLKIDSDMEILSERILEEYGLTYGDALRFREAEYNFSAGTTEVNKCKRQLSALGYVNINAIEDYKALKVRYDEMDTQRNDLEAAEDDLRTIIKELTGEMLTRFTKGFAEIASSFQKVFRELFGGGNARLVLEDTEDGDPLNAGIEIVAEPPGKKLQSITLLSGGEKALTAIAILFAILRLRPMPFCVLDEIEAALDDANTDRFARYLKRFSGETQFIVITHKKPTMELTDALYGVTMEEKGVSKMVSVKLAEAIKTAEIA